MKLPRFVSPAAIPNRQVLPAVAAVAAQGFLSQCAPAARFGSAKESRPWLLLSYEQRQHVTHSIVGSLDSLPWYDDAVAAVLRPDGTRGRWRNAEHLWVDAGWLQALPWDTEVTIAASLVRELAAALKLEAK